MKYKLWGLLSLLSFMSNAESLNLDIEVDKGTLSLSYSEQVDQPEITYKKPNGCDSELSIDESSSKIKVSHLGGICSQGYNIRMVLPYYITDTDIKLKNGLIKFSDLQNVNELIAFVNAGMISTTQANVRVTRTPDYAGAKALYSGEGSLNVSLKVDSGMISL